MKNLSSNLTKAESSSIRVNTRARPSESAPAREVECREIRNDDDACRSPLGKAVVAPRRSATASPQMTDELRVTSRPLQRVLACTSSARNALRAT